MKAAIIILSDPKSGSEEALGRVFNALAAAYDFEGPAEPTEARERGLHPRKEPRPCPLHPFTTRANDLPKSAPAKSRGPVGARA